jgi:hypothetical protein
MMKEVIEEIEAQNRKYWLGCPEDLRRMRKRIGAENQNFAVCVFGFGDMSSTAYFLYMLYNNANQRKVDLESLKTLACDWLSFQAGRCARYYNMTDSEAVTAKAIAALKEVRSYEDFSEIIKAIQHYYSQLSYWFDLELPWKELAEKYEEIKGKAD